MRHGVQDVCGPPRAGDSERHVCRGHPPQPLLNFNLKPKQAFAQQGWAQPAIKWSNEIVLD
jgi:hypothetical protein